MPTGSVRIDPGGSVATSGRRPRAGERDAQAIFLAARADQTAVVHRPPQLLLQRCHHLGIHRRHAGQIAEHDQLLVGLLQVLDRRFGELDGAVQVGAAIALAQLLQGGARGAEIRRGGEREARGPAGEHDRDRVTVPHRTQ
jgi:hypothetical protein